VAVYMVTYDLRTPGKDYAPVHEYLKQFAYCKDLESFWLIDTKLSTANVRDGLKQHVDANDKVFVARLHRDWASLNYACTEWLNNGNRSW
jgi:hypothetical protein